MKLGPILFPLALALAASMPSAHADTVVVANAKSGVLRLTRDDVIKIYLGRYRLLNSGIGAEPIDLPDDAPLKEHFYRHLVNKSLAEINAYWARLIFSGKTQPPIMLPSSDEALKIVMRRPGALAYVDRSKVGEHLTIVYELGD